MFYPIIYIRSPHSLQDQQYSIFITDDDKEYWSIRESVRPIENVHVFTQEELDKRDKEIAAGAFPDNEADGYVFCGKCGKTK